MSEMRNEVYIFRSSQTEKQIVTASRTTHFAPGTSNPNPSSSIVRIYFVTTWIICLSLLWIGAADERPSLLESRGLPHTNI